MAWKSALAERIIVIPVRGGGGVHKSLVFGVFKEYLWTKYPLNLP